VRGWVLYDASCTLCLALAARAQPTLQAGGFQFEPLQSPWVRELLDLPEDQLLVEMRVLTR
jgi:predicted DCC family thiol-disulfide oxidoreductase YuxK